MCSLRGHPLTHSDTHYQTHRSCRILGKFEPDAAIDDEDDDIFQTDAMRSELVRISDSFTSKKKLSVFIGTWNMNGQPPGEVRARPRIADSGVINTVSLHSPQRLVYVLINICFDLLCSLQDVSAWLKPKGVTSLPDIYAIGFQEIVVRSSESFLSAFVASCRRVHLIYCDCM